MKNNFAARFAEAHKKTAITVFIIAILASVAFSVIVMQLLVGPRARWNQTYGGPNADQAFYAVQTSDGGYAIAGWTESFGAGSADFWLIKTDSNSNIQWNQTYGGSNADRALCVIQTSDGGYAAIGFTASFGAGGLGDMWLIKTDSNSNMQWNQTYGGAGTEYGRFVIQTSDGGYAIAGDTTSFGAGYFDVWLIKTDSNGNMQWNQTYGGADGDYGVCVIQTSDGGYAIAGSTESFGAGYFDVWLIKTDSNGNMQWNQTYGGPRAEDGLRVIQTSDGGYAIAGSTESFGAGSADFWLIKTDSNSNMQWNQTYGGAGTEYGWSVIQTSDGGYAIAGSTESFGAGSYDFWLIKTCFEGESDLA